MTTQTVNLIVADQIVATAVIDGLPTERYPGDLSWLAPVIEWDGKVFLFKGQAVYGDIPTAEYFSAKVVHATVTPVAGAVAA